MPRPEPPAPPEWELNTTNMITEVRSYELITPLFGGGVEPGQADPISVVRASEVRGQLRFWWRAVRGGQFATVEAMREAEEALWGGPAREQNGVQLGGQSLVQVTVDLEDSGWPLIPEYARGQTLYAEDRQKVLTERLYTPTLARAQNGVSFYHNERRNEFKSFTVGDPESVDGYLAFPLRGDAQRPARHVYEGVRFTLTLRYPGPKHKRVQAARTRFPDLLASDTWLDHELAAALWAWETFGGIGARTRRGFGALTLTALRREGVAQVVDRPPEARGARAWLDERFRLYCLVGAAPDNVPHLTQRPDYKLCAQGTSGKAVWRALGESLKAFRQPRRPGYARQGQRPSRYGRSKWPEPDAVRDIAGTAYEDQNDPAHNHSTPIYSPSIAAFPRAAFGLPISFEFHKDQTDPRRAKTIDPPGKNTLEGDDPAHERFTSPLILRPLRCANNSVVGLALLLAGTRPPPMQLTVWRGSTAHTQTDLTATLSANQAHDIGRQASIPRLTATRGALTTHDLLLAFLDSLKALS